MSERILSPRIYIGAGGSGRRMLALLKRRVEQDLISPAERASFQFLALDCDEYQEGDCRPLDPYTEFLHIGGFDPKEARKAEFMKNAVAEWWYDSYTPSYVQQGAGAVRLIGRLCYYFHYRRIQQAVQDAITRATQFAATQQVGEEVAIYIIGSLAGGTGSSMLLDLALLARKACRYKQVYVNGVIMLPDVFTVAHSTTQWKFKERWMANGYAAFKELVHFNEHPEKFRPLYRDRSGREEAAETPRLFDQCFLVEPVLGATSTVGKDGEIFDLAAEALYLFSASAHGSKAGSTLVNTDGIYYASIGTQTIEYPIHFVQGFAQHHLTRRFLQQTIGTEEPDSVTAQEVRETLETELKATGWWDLVSSAAVWGQGPNRPEAVSFPLVASDRARAIAESKAGVERFRTVMAVHMAQKVEAQRLEWQSRVDNAVKNGKSLHWCRAYLRSFKEHVERQCRELQTEVRALQDQHAASEGELGRPRRALAGLFKDRNQQVKQETAALNDLYTQQIPNRLAMEALHVAAAKLLAEWLTPTIDRFDQLWKWMAHEGVAIEQQRTADWRQKLELHVHANPSAFVSVPPDQLGELVERLAKDLRFGIEPVSLLWRSVTTDQRGETVLTNLEKQITAAADATLDLNLLSAWELGEGQGTLRERFLKAAESCRPFWSYVKEHGEEHMTKVAVVSMPTNPTWAKWFAQLQRPLQQIPGDPHRIVFLAVEGTQNLDKVYLKEMPEWFRMYELVRRAYDQGEESRPLHIHRAWEDLPEIDPSNPSSVSFLFGPAEALGFVLRKEGVWVLQLDGGEFTLGADDRSAMLALMELPEPWEKGLREALAPHTLIKQMKHGVLHQVREYIRESAQRGEQGLAKARLRQAQNFLNRLRTALANEGGDADGAKTNRPPGAWPVSDRSAAAFQADDDLATGAPKADHAGGPARGDAPPASSDGDPGASTAP